MTTNSVTELSATQKLQLIEDLWNDLSASPEDVPVHDWHIEKVERSEAEMKANPNSWLTWEQVEENARNNYGR